MMVSKNLRQITGVLGWVVLLLVLLFACLALYLPAAPSMPVDDVDPAWTMGMAYALANQLVIGRELIFTFGPFAGVYTKAYQPDIFHFSLYAATLMAAGLFLLLALLKRGVSYYWVLLLVFIPIGLRYMGDPIFLMYPYLLGLLLSRVLEPEQDSMRLPLTWPVKFAAVVVLLPLGLMPLIKGSFLVSCMGCIVLCLAYSAYHRNRFFLVAFSVVPVLGMCVGWRLSGYALADLPGYFSSMSPIISGYAQAMSDPGNEAPLLLFVAACLGLGWQLLFRSESAFSVRLFLALNAGMFLFLAFKAGFVRYDTHALVAGLCLLIAVLSVRLVRKEGVTAGLMVLAVLAWLAIDRSHRETSTDDFYQGIKGAVKATSALLRDYDDLSVEWKGQYRSASERIANDCGVPPAIDARLDIYPWRISCAIASDLNWSGRPILQSYSVYTKELLELNRDHLRGNRAPDVLLIDIAPIDDRYPSLDESLSWPVFVRDFQLAKHLDQFVQLQRREQRRELDRQRLQRVKARFGESVALPQESGNLWAEIELQSTLLGRLWALFIKPPEIFMAVTWADSGQSTYRLVPEIAAAGFLLSPTLSDREQFATWLNHGNGGSTVESIRLEAQYGVGVLWGSDYSVSFSRFDFPEDGVPVSADSADAEEVPHDVSDEGENHDVLSPDVDSQRAIQNDEGRNEVREEVPAV